jgi:chorismate synthase
MVEQIEAAKKEGNTLGGVFEVYASGLPIGLGSYSQWDRRLEGRIAQGLMSLNAIKAVEMGLGKKVAQLRGSEVHDEYVPASEGRRGVEYKTNRSGGIEGGMSTGQTLQVRATMKPISTLMKPLSSVDLRTGEASLAHIERSDMCAVPAAAVIAESILALILCDEILIKFGGDSLPEVQSRVYEWKKHQHTL